MRKSKFTIEKRFEYLTQLVTMVGKQKVPSAIITGEGGLGKTWTVQNTLQKLKLKDLSLYDEFAEGMVQEGNYRKAFRFVKGYSTAKALYKTLYTNNGATIVFDDCDNILKDKIGINILKGALDSYDTRIISWRNSLPKDNDPLPSCFEFLGQVIFISNLPLAKIPQPIRSRSLSVDVGMTTTEKYERMQQLIDSSEFMPEFPVTAKRDALKEIMNNKTLNKDVSLRTLCTAVKIRSCGGDWKGLLEYCTTTQ
jgi:hypothetical protein